MRKRIFALAAIFALLGGSLVMAGGKTESGASGKVKAGLVIDVSGLGDQSINDQAYVGLDRANKELGLEVKLMEPQDVSQFLDMNQKLAESGYGIIVNNAFAMADAVAQAADANPNLRTIILDTYIDNPNVLSVTYETHQGVTMLFMNPLRPFLKAEIWGTT